MANLCTLRLSRHHLLKAVYKISFIISRNALDLAHKIYGSLRKGPPIVVLHGFLGSKRNWDSVCKKLADSTSLAVVAADLRNHGESPHHSSHAYPELAADVSQLMSKLAIKSAYVVGHSMGGRTGMVFALTEPSKVLKLVVVDISPISSPGMKNSAFPQLMEVMKSIDFTGLDYAQARSLARKTVTATGLFNPEGIGFILMNVGKKSDGSIGWIINVDVLSKYFDVIASFPNLDSKYEGPVLFIGGAKSNFLPSEDISAIRQLFPKAELIYLKGVGHNVHADNPTSFVEIVSTFIKH